MATQTYNPYAFFEDVFSDGMDYVIQNLPSGTVQMQDLTDAVTEYVIQWVIEQAGPGGSGASGSGIIPLPAPFEILLNSLIPTSVNDYTNMKITTNNLRANAAQHKIIGSLIFGVKNNTYDSLNNFFDGIEEQIAICNCGNTNKSSLYMSTAIARANNNYWINILNGSADTPWAPYLNTVNWAANYINLPAWIISAFLGSLSGFSQFQAANMNKANFQNTLGTITGQAGVLVSSLGLASGKIIFQLPQGPGKSC